MAIPVGTKKKVKNFKGKPENQITTGSFESPNIFLGTEKAT